MDEPGLAPVTASVPAAAGRRNDVGLEPEQAQGATRFEQWVESFRARARARGISDATYTRVMGGLKPDTSVYALDRSQPEFSEKLWQYLNRRVSDWRITEGKEKAKEHAALLARIEQDYGVAPAVMVGLWGIEFGLRRSARAEEPHAAGDPGARRARLGRAAPPQLLGAGAAQRAGHRRARLEHAAGDARLLGGRHGPHPVDAGGVAQCRRRLRRRRPRRARSASPTTRSPAPRNIWSSAASIAAASIGATRCAPARRAAAMHRAATRPGRRPASCAPTASRSRSRTPPPSSGCRCRAGPASCSARISMRCARTTRR